MRVLCVAEKPSIARSITDILSGGRYETIRYGRTSNFSFDYPQTNSSFIVTYVAGHITELDFPEAYRKWASCDPFTLFDAPIEIKYPPRVNELVKNIEIQARGANVLMIWTDCDREGEHIGYEISQVCRKVNARIRIERARFSAIIAEQIHNAAQNPFDLDRAQADAVYARQILDLRLGAAFTRMQCLSLQGHFGNLLEKKLISYGPCQFPTLGFVVSRYEQVKAFVPETFWYIYLALNRPGENGAPQRETTFKWKRGHLFDFDVALMLYEMVLEQPTAKVTKVVKKNTKKWKPYPLTTVDLQKSGSRLLRMTPKQILDTADALYQRGILSYPRTETDQYDDKFDFAKYVQKQTSSPDWGAFATRLQQGEFNKPRKGKKNDKAHPPIHPTAYAGNLTGNEKKVYEYVTRRYLASCSKDAEGFQTTITVEVNNEEFTANGLLVLRRNYLEVFPYDNWTSHELPSFEEGEEFMPSICELRDGETKRPSLLTEADLVGLMDKNGIGTDATIAQHINTIVEREYVMERKEGNTKYLVPSTLGVGLVHGYNQIGFEKSLSKPQLRRETERSMVQICDGEKTKDNMLEDSINQYKEVFILARREFNRVIQSVGHYVQGDGQPQGDNNGGDGRGGNQGPQRRGPRPRGGGGGGGPPPGSDDDFDRGPPPPPAARRGNNQTRTASRQDGAPQHENGSDFTGTKCHCGVPAMERTSNTESTRGRKFWRCGGSGKDCDFFQWVETLPNRPVSRNPIATGGSGSFGSGRMYGAPDDGEKTIPAKRKNPESGDEPSRQCLCKLPAAKRTVVKEGPNKGRQFWKCPNMEDSQCKFFEWDDEVSSSAAPAHTGSQFGSSTRQNPSQDTGRTVQGECYKCHQPGHWANACPNGGQAESTRAGSSSFGTSGTKEGGCYKCGQNGHWASACPNPDTSRGGGGAGISANKRLRKAAGLDDDDDGGNKCYKCGLPGHFSNACKSSSTSSRGTSRGRGKARGSSNGGGSGRGWKGKGSGRGRGRGKSSFSALDI